MILLPRYGTYSDRTLSGHTGVLKEKIKKERKKRIRTHVLTTCQFQDLNGNLCLLWLVTCPFGSAYDIDQLVGTVYARHSKKLTSNRLLTPVDPRCLGDL